MSLAASPIPQHLSSASGSGGHSTPRTSISRSSPHASPSQGSPRGSPRPSSISDVDTILRASGGDTRRALEGLIAERSNLQSQNGQLWKLIEKQRAQSAQLVSENDRLRAERDRANKSLVAAGLDPVNGKRIPNSSSAVGLGLRPEAPTIRRANSDRDEKIVAASLNVPGNSSAPSSPVEPTKQLLPSPMADAKLRRESRMVFPPEVTSFMTLAESPRNHEHKIAPVPMPVPLPAPSPSSFTTSPAVSTREPEQTVVPSSSRPLAAMAEVEEEPTPRDRPPPPRKSSMKSPTQSNFRDMPSPAATSFKDIPLPPLERDARKSEDAARMQPDVRPSVESSRLPRIAPALLPHTRLTIPTSTVFPNALGRDVLCFIVCVTIRMPNAQPVTWNVAKLFSAFIDLDTRVRARSGKARKDLKTMLAPLPDGKAWKDFAPSKVDQRKAALEAYLQSLLIAPLSDKSDLCDFLSTDPVQVQANASRKEGYLTKKGKNFGGWRTRYFVLEGPVMEYYEARGGPHLGSILVTGAQIGRQNRPSESSDDKNFRHAFLIIEAPKRGAATRHVLCADSDLERDSWIEILVKHVDSEPPAMPTAPSQPQVGPPVVQNRKRSDSRKSSKDVVVTAAQPLNSLGPGDSKFTGAPSPSLINSMEHTRQSQPPSMSFPTLPASQSEKQTSLSNPPDASPQAETRPRRQSLMPGRAHASNPPPAHTAAYLTKLSQEGMSAPPGEKERERKAKSGRFWPSFGKGPEKVARPVFGVPLADSIAIASIANLPAIVFRCIEWLEVKHAELEEGIYRLSGSSAVIKGLKDRFDMEGDVNLKAVDEHWDPHAIAGLLKTFLRDLPTSLLTRDLHPRFLAVMDLIESSARVGELARLVADLPPPNYALLRALTAHLILIVKHSATNKMTLRNIGIVFSPTLGIPAGIFSELVSHFGAIFDDEPLPAAPERNGEVASESTNKRNSILYAQGGVDALLGLSGRSLDPTLEDSASEASVENDSAAEEDPESEFLSSENLSNSGAPTSSSIPSLSSAPSTGMPAQYPSAAAVRQAKAAAKAADRGLVLEQPITNGADTIRSPRKLSSGPGSGSGSGSNSGHGTAGLPASPRPPARAGTPAE